MSLNRYLAWVGNALTMVAFTQVSAGPTSAGQGIALNSLGTLDATMLPAGIGPDAVTATATAAISANTLVNIYSNAGVTSCRPADNTVAGVEANGYATAAITNGSSGTVNCASGIVSGFSGLTPGVTAFLGTVGGVVTTAPSTAGNIIQVVGKTLSATSIQFNPQTPLTVA